MGSRDATLAWPLRCCVSPALELCARARHREEKCSRSQFTVEPARLSAQRDERRRRKQEYRRRPGRGARCRLRGARAAAAPSLDAVIAAVRVLEDNPLFNAGRGAVLNRDGMAELDASLMDGRTLGAGAVSGLQHVRNPIDLARLVMEQVAARDAGGHAAPRSSRARRAWSWCRTNTSARRARQRQLERSLRGALSRENELEAFGTVGAVALDSARQSRRGHLHRRHDRQTLGPRRRLTHHRRRHLRQQRELRGVGHRTRRILHPHRGRARHLRAGGIPEDPAGAGRRQRAQRQDEEARRQWRRRSPSIRAARSCSISTARECFAACAPRRVAARSRSTV